MNEKRALEIVGTLLMDMETCTITTPAAHLLLLQSGLVLASQVVQSDKHKQMHRDFADRVQAALKTLYPYDFTRPITQKELRAASKTEADLTLTVTYRDLYNAICALQLMTRYQEAMPVAMQIAGIGFRFQDIVALKHPDSKKLLNMGWDSRHDR